MKKVKILIMALIVVASGSLALSHLQSDNNSSLGIIANQTDLASAAVPNFDPVWPTVK
ncbi:hypothetical protein SAMN05443252_1033 [Bacillus sp. OV322]|uniref:hypothetical protein n=1 Tax=Bacillus sp. OV322 TaxID=1882764 RepID=UPI0008E0BF54|nr:hypothetical protein [Bacillus sp. OV322]SFC35170.1 hypothetical protein SAMN05443252_1033 [Bacillus sp. OV322]